MSKSSKNEPLNFGPVTSKWMDAIGIKTIGELEDTGLEETYERLLLHGFNATAVMLYALDARLNGIGWEDVSPQRREELKRLAANVKKRLLR
jgi:hypothetical protein